MMVASNTDTRSQWFGTVPEHWQIVRNKNAFRIVSKKVGDRFTDYDLLSLTLQGVKLRDTESGKGKFPASFDTYQEVQRDDIVFCLFDIDETPRTVGLSSLNGMVTGAYTVARCSRVAAPRFVTYFYLSIDERKGLRPFYSGLRKVVRADTFLNATFPLPDRDTQNSIADFLDRETARVDQLIEKKQRLVELAHSRREQKIAALLESVGRSIPPQSLRWLVRVRSGDFISNDIFEKEATQDTSIPVVGGNGLMAYTSQSNSPEKSIVVGRVGALCGNVHFIESKSWITDNALIVRVISKDVEPRFLVELLRGANLNDKASKSAQPLITGETVKSLKVKIPDWNSQLAVCGKISQLSEDNRTLARLVEASVGRLREFRSALITAAVTGQIDVNTWSRRGSTDRRLDQIEEAMRA